MKDITRAVFMFYHPQKVDNIIGIKHGDEIPLDILYDFIEALIDQGWNVMLQCTCSTIHSKRDALMVWADNGTFKQK